ncbi:uncharacterized protein BDZ83DRAFT_634751 [Colletotrichum acutatum]|uniref:Uncharacterized protein n=1 Tax=Glomerella acutata TaxID=27357 RepID=A0AAD8UCR8_GLOAC|nr:uncharacterized protein BDZ83DRAFT_634751 [Colletotrichum acutatum]KAK1716702.1 hypothetical protein BDZ83DRAFT_634751 [Colletotrichum acutatum]
MHLQLLKTVFVSSFPARLPYHQASLHPHVYPASTSDNIAFSSIRNLHLYWINFGSF